MILCVRNGILMGQLVYNALFVLIMMLLQENVRMSIQTVKLGIYQMETVLLVLKVMVTLQQMVKLSMVYAQFIIAQMQLRIWTAKFLCLEDNANNVSKDSMKLAENVLPYHLDVQWLKILLVFNVKPVIF